MWRVIAEEDLICNECRHDIPAGSECLSQMPVDMPEKFSRGKYQNFCISCPKCDLEKVELPCYTRRLDHWYTVRKTTEESVRCGHCDRTIPGGTRTIAQKIYAWAESGANSRFKDSSSTISGAVAGAAEGVYKSGSGNWHNLSYSIKQKFRTAGLGRSRGIRTPGQARHFYETSVPQIVRNGGEDAVKSFLKGKQASHIKSVANAPSQAKASSNVIWESSKRNAARGGRNMSSSELSVAKSGSEVFIHQINGSEGSGSKWLHCAGYGGACCRIGKLLPLEARTQDWQPSHERCCEQFRRYCWGRRSRWRGHGSHTVITGTTRSPGYNSRWSGVGWYLYLPYCQGCPTRPPPRRTLHTLLQETEL